MTVEHTTNLTATEIERITELEGADLHDLCDAAEAAIRDGGGFGWLQPPERHVMETYWKGVLLVPERDLLVARVDGVIAGSAQLLRAPRNNEAQAYVGTLSTFFMAPWARGHGLARRLVESIEELALSHGLKVLNLDVRESQRRAIQIYHHLGFVHWGTNPCYALVDGEWARGYYYYKYLAAEPA
ncbi:Protein N-acetyltransferase, RimJ/RimL family [Limimonas halophila]|uniref:Protein N-acetyltransferase, RimJ/RimL family n=1 Tax=Limimonas halophila TaxID=1082479 RepID=A0A1G7RBZ5_9PROT|nr:GNAT family N-acetyltransferase [Limimonas halophila]SDG08287.1 Protein N-acetyltransferase, RimJ/RimL family [Limimonas halophila]